MKRSVNSGFTMIELIMVITILGILAAIAMPKLVDLKSEATAAQIEGIKGAVASANAINYAAWVASGGAKGVQTFGGTCQTVIPPMMQGGALPSGWTGTGATGISGALGTDTTCAVNGPNGLTFNVSITTTRNP